MAALLKFAFTIDYIPAAIISCFVVIGYTAIAGMSGVIITDMIQFIIIIFMIIAIFIPGINSDNKHFQVWWNTKIVEVPRLNFIDSFLNNNTVHNPTLAYLLSKTTSN